MDSCNDRLRMTVYTSDKNLIRQLLVEMINEDNNRIELSDNCFLVPWQKYQPSSHFTSIPEVLDFTINFVSGVGAGLLAAWIYDKLGKSPKTKAKIQEIRLDLSDKKSIELLIISVTSSDKHN